MMRAVQQQLDYISGKKHDGPQPEMDEGPEQQMEKPSKKLEMQSPAQNSDEDMNDGVTLYLL